MPISSEKEILKITLCNTANQNEDCKDRRLPFCVSPAGTGTGECKSVKECFGPSDTTSCNIALIGAEAKCNSDNKCVKQCDERKDGNMDCSNEAYPFCVRGECKKDKKCTMDKSCKSFYREYVCRRARNLIGLCEEKYLVSTYQSSTNYLSYLKSKDTEFLITDRNKATTDAIAALKNGGGSIYAFKKDQRYFKGKVLK